MNHALKGEFTLSHRFHMWINFKKTWSNHQKNHYNIYYKSKSYELKLLEKFVIQQHFRKIRYSTTLHQCLGIVFKSFHMFVFLISIFFYYCLYLHLSTCGYGIRDLHISTCECTVQYNGIGNLHAFLLGKRKRRRTGHIIFFTNHPPMHGRWKIWLHSGITWHASPSSKSSKHTGQPPFMDVPWLPWFKVAVSVIDSEGPEAYRSRCIDLVSDET